VKRHPALAGPAAALLFAMVCSTIARAEPAAEANAPLGEEKDRDVYRKKLLELTRPGPYYDLVGSVMFGDGIRFNNPYRLSHELGSTGESLSSTAPYLEVAVGATLGRPNALQHGARLAWTVSTSGVPQQVLTPAYLAFVRLAPTWVAYGWAGLPIVLEPDVNVGAELAAGGAWLARAGLGATFALVFDGFYGAGTAESRAAFYPVASAQLGVFVNYEVLP
jgi:hypothetical protein